MIFLTLNKTFGEGSEWIFDNIKQPFEKQPSKTFWKNVLIAQWREGPDWIFDIISTYSNIFLHKLKLRIF